MQYASKRRYIKYTKFGSSKALKVEEVRRVLSIIRRVVSYFHRSPKACTALREKQKLLNLPLKKLKNDVVTRWNSAYDMVERYLEMQPAVQASLLTKDLRKGDTHNLPASLNETDMAIAEDIMQIMKPLKTATVVMCDEKQSTLSVVHPLFSSILKSTEAIESDSEVAKDMKLAIKQDLEKRYKEEVDSSLLHTSAALDPRFKDLAFLQEVTKVTVFSNIAVAAASLMDDASEMDVKEEIQETDRGPDLPNLPDVELEGEPDVSPPKAKVAKLERGTRCALDELLGVSITGQEGPSKRSNLDIVHEEITMYRKAPSIPYKENAITWWKMKNIFYPNLGKLAKNYLWGYSGDIVTAQRASLKSEQVDKLVFLKKNLKM